MDLNSEKKVFTIIDYINLFLKHKKIILIYSLTAAILSFLLAFFVIKPVFLSTGVIKTATSKSSMLGGLLSTTGLAELGDFGDLAPGSGSSAQDLALYENILMSRGNIEETVLKFNIMEEEDFKYMFDAIKYFRENIITINKDKVAGTLSIGIYDIDPSRAKEIVDFLIYQLNKKNIELSVQNARNNRKFIEERYEIVKNDLKTAEDSLQIYQDKFGVAPDIQIQVAAKGSLELEAQIKSEEIKLELLSKIISSDQSEVKAQQEKINALKKQLFEINNSDYSESKLNLKGSPNIILNYFRLRRNVEIQNKILVTLIPMLEQSKIEENRETPTVLILDSPNVPDKKSKPKRLIIIVLSTAVVFFGTYIYYYLKDVVVKKYSLNE
ncbi:MAG: hypothetical protein IPG09_13415 [Ignavibacteria bacterium]|nr:hypothetical protein [Ignavibacteria bacterium]MBK7445868.1 hypothetical protein [Ignavibacteria bacterium]